jgi:hypothetical protein
MIATRQRGWFCRNSRGWKAQTASGAATSYKLYRIIEPTDTDDFEYLLDPPFYARGNRLGCDGKAGRTMQTVAVNCRPLNASGSN